MLLLGSLFVSDAGSPMGNFTNAATYNVSLAIQNSTGVLILTFDSGTDVITNHAFTVTCLCSEDSGFEVKFDGQSISLPLDQVDPVWNGTYANYYIASYGQDAPLEAMRGSIDPLSFPGLHQGYYVELRLR